MADDSSNTMQDASARNANAQFTSLGKYEEVTVGVASNYIIPGVLHLLGELPRGTRVLDVGCGMGALAAKLSRRGCSVVGIDLDENNLKVAQAAYPDVRFVKAAANARILEVLGTPPFDVVTCTEVVEHLYSPSDLVQGCYHACKSGGRFAISAPYHGYLKNLLIALTGHGSSHYDPLWEGGHIKFFDRAKMTNLLTSNGFVNVSFHGVGRFPFLWKSLVMSGERPRL